ncbi:hypothetical protein F4808DRAFT_464620 [Astrocystis sublimbata]|nr:hypothetical protein F4808DRAFT_464620 [Astrocystis sublimbata]
MTANGSPHERDRERQATVNILINGQSLFKPALPLSHININFPCTIGPGCPACPDLMHDAATLAALIPNMETLGSQFKDFLESEVARTSWVEFPFCDVDFGPVLGEPGLMQIPPGQWSVLSLLAPRRPDDGDIEVVITLTGIKRKDFRPMQSFNRM